MDFQRLGSALLGRNERCSLRLLEVNHDAREYVVDEFPKVLACRARTEILSIHGLITFR